MRELVLDASVVVKWFRHEGERHVEPARALRDELEAGGLTVLAPSLLGLDLVNVAGRRWGWSEPSLTELSRSLDELGIELVEPQLVDVARWTARGLTAYDAAYVAVAETVASTLVTDDELMVRIASPLASALADVAAGPS